MMNSVIRSGNWGADSDGAADSAWGESGGHNWAQSCIIHEDDNKDSERRDFSLFAGTERAFTCQDRENSRSLSQ
jgi:hypothetical protein